MRRPGPTDPLSGARRQIRARKIFTGFDSGSQESSFQQQAARLGAAEAFVKTEAVIGG